MTSQGRRANDSGRMLEDGIRTSVWRQLGLRAQPFVEWKGDRPALVENVPYKTLYDTVGRSEFVLYTQQRSYRIECKWQAVSGSVDEKFPYLLESLKRVDEDECLVVVGGGGAKPSAVEWLRKAAQASSKPIRVVSLEEFMGLVQRMGHGA